MAYESGQSCFYATDGSIKPFDESLFTQNANTGILSKWSDKALEELFSRALI